jgi:hypothetical protein
MNVPAVQPTQPETAAQKRAAKQRQILGLDRGRPAAQSYSVEREVDSYLTDEECGTGILEFWQVRSYIKDLI